MKPRSLTKLQYSLPFIAGLGGFLAVVNPVIAQTWTETTAPNRHWTSIACSADGVRIVAAAGYSDDSGTGGQNTFDYPIHTSSDSGATWTQTSAPLRDWRSVAASADGSKLVAASGPDGHGNGGLIYTSTNSGASWSPTSAPSNSWSSVASSADGTKLVAMVRFGSIFTSTNSGAAWTQISLPSNYYYYCYAVASSADGTKLAALGWVDDIENDNNIGGFILISQDSGSTWSQTNAPFNPWSAVAVSADGSKLIAAPLAKYRSGDGLIYTSVDSGATWKPSGAPILESDARAVACSSDGTVLMAAVGLVLYTTADSGAHWTAGPNSLYGYWHSVACAVDGNKLIAASPSSIFTSPSPLPPLPSPRLEISASGQSLGIPWLVPSTSYVLQESSDLSSTTWTNVPMPPTLNFTNLHFQVTVSPSTGTRFYRLKRQ